MIDKEKKKVKNHSWLNAQYKLPPRQEMEHQCKTVIRLEMWAC